MPGGGGLAPRGGFGRAVPGGVAPAVSLQQGRCQRPVSRTVSPRGVEGRGGCGGQDVPGAALASGGREGVGAGGVDVSVGETVSGRQETDSGRQSLGETGFVKGAVEVGLFEERARQGTLVRRFVRGGSTLNPKP